MPRSFYRPSAEIVAAKLLGHLLVRRSEAGISAGVIVETEAYLTGDEASHSFRGETKRNRAMWGPPGHAYVYFIYGNHWCVNAVCQPAGIGEAVLIRAVEPWWGRELMQGRRVVSREVDLTNGPGKLCAALDIDRRHDGTDLCDERSGLFIVRNKERKAFEEKNEPVVISARIGITKAAERPLRFYYERNQFASKHRAGKTGGGIAI